MRVLVTGATGYLGSWVCRELRSRRHAVWAHNSRDVLGWIGDAAVSDAVVHLAWASTARDNVVEHFHCYTRTRLLLDYLSLVNSACRSVFASTCAVYGDRREGLTKETTPTSVVSAATDYQFWKFKAERLFLDERDETVLRLGSLMGRGWNGAEKTDVTVNAFAADAYAVGKVTCWGPDAWKPIIHVRDVAEVVCRAVEEPEKWQGVTNVSWKNAMAGDIASSIGLWAGATVEYADAPVGRPSASVQMDNSLLLQRLGPTFKFRTMEEAMREFETYVPQPGHKFDPARWR